MDNLNLIFQCPSCGSTEGLERGNYVKCKCCNNQYRRNLQNEPVYADLSYAVNERQEADFDKARRRYDDLIAKYKTGVGMEEAYWGRFLCEQYVIFYQNDAGESIPSFWNINDEPCQKSESYKKALQYGEFSGNRENYEKLAELIEEYKEKYRKVSKERPQGSQIFICFKDSGTDDRNLGYTIYNKFSGKYNIFFSRESLNDVKGNDYEPYIYHALKTAKVLIVLCSERQNLESKWVHNEWWRFWKFSKGTEKTIIPVCRENFDPSQLPDELRNCQAHKEDVELLSNLSERLDAILKNEEGPLTSFEKELNIVNAMFEADQVDNAKIQILELIKESVGRPHDHISALLLHAKIYSNNYKHLNNEHAVTSIAHAEETAKENDVAIGDMPEYRRYRAAIAKKRVKKGVLALLLAALLGAGAFFVWYLMQDTSVKNISNSKYHATVEAVDGGFPQGTEFQVSEALGDSKIQSMIRTLSVVQSTYRLYDMELWRNGSELTVDGSVTVTMPLPSGISAERAAVYYMSGDEPQKIASEVSGGQISFTTDHFSIYMIAEEKDGCDHIAVTDPAVPPTCTAEGWTAGSHCSLCHEILSAPEAVPAKGHTPGAAATCTESQHCTVCRVELAAALGHQPGAAANCVDNQICTVCRVELAPARGHQPTVVTNCTDAQKCRVCHIELSPAKGHTPGAEATCTEAQKCTVCRLELVSAKGHTPGGSATCTEAQTCTVCNEELKSALGHQPGAEATCTEGQICTVCRKELAPALGHKKGGGVSCTEASSCTVCGAELAAASGHQPNGDASCTEPSVCKVCDVVIAPAKGHKAQAEATCTVPSKCADCGAELAAAKGHKVNQWTVDREMNGNTPGLKSGVCSVCSQTVQEEFMYSEGLAYTMHSNGTCTVTGIGTCTDTMIIIPSEYEGAAVTAIGAEAFKNCASIVSLTIPSTVKTVGEFAFLGCSRLASLTLNEGLEKICGGAFYKCPITSLVIPDSVTVIETPYGNYFEQNYYHGAFEGCTKLTSVVIGSGLANIERETFLGCTSLVSVTVGKNVDTISESAFQGCTSLTDVTMGTASNVRLIGRYAFYNCTALSAIEIPASTETIGEYAFLGCSGLTSLTLNEGLKTIRQGAFYKCPITSLVIPDSVTAIETPYDIYMDRNNYHGAFEGCERLANVVIGNGLTKIDAETFRGCSAMKSVTVGKAVRSVGDYAFYNCSSLTDIRFLGTMEECNAIVIGQDFAASVPADTIVCSDGNLAWG